ncbi:MAG: DEAD/DEAH box helicase [Litorimonas sp.]
MSSQNTIEEVSADEVVDVTFTQLGLDDKILKALGHMGYEKPTPIQARAIPAAMQQRDVLGIAQTGTGKTGAFTLPTMHKLAKGRARARMPRCLIICPTRELAAQVAENVEQYGKYLKLEMALLIGGVSFSEQDRKLMKGVDILIATPGRLLDQFERGKILMTGVQTLVVDEADRMLDMGFIPDIEKIFKLTPFTRQVLFFSATMPNEIKRLVDQFLHQPVSIQIARQSTTAETVRQRIVRVPSSDPKQKRTALRYLIEHENVENGIVFCNRKKDVDIVAKSLNVHGHDAAPIHGDLAQSLRTETLDRFRNGKIKYLVASDVAARGLDVPSVSHVFNYDVPNHSEDYVHRVGRTGRAGREGDAIMLVARLDQKNYDEILNLIKVESIEEYDIPGIEDFPKDGGKYRRGGRNDKKTNDKGRGRNRGRSRGRNNDTYDNRSQNKPSKTDDISSKKDTSSEKTNPKKTSSRRSAPKRKEPNGTVTDTQNTAKTSTKNDTETSANSGTGTSPKSSDTKPAREKTKEKSQRQRSSKNRSDTRNRDSRHKNDKPKPRYRDSIGKADHAGFGDEMPAFFKTPLKDK